MAESLLETNKLSLAEIRPAQCRIRKIISYPVQR